MLKASKSEIGINLPEGYTRIRHFADTITFEYFEPEVFEVPRWQPVISIYKDKRRVTEVSGDGNNVAVGKDAKLKQRDKEKIDNSKKGVPPFLIYSVLGIAVLAVVGWLTRKLWRPLLGV